MCVCVFFSGSYGINLIKDGYYRKILLFNLKVCDLELSTCLSSLKTYPI